MFSKLKLCLLFICLLPSLSMASTKAIIYQAVLSREVVDLDTDETYFQTSEYNSALSEDEECAMYDTKGKYSNYELITTPPQEINEGNAGAFFQIFEGVRENVEVKRVVIMMCLGINELN